jgi:hypothetical protein
LHLSPAAAAATAAAVPLTCFARTQYTTSDLGVQGIGFIIQSDKFSAAHLAHQVELFVRQTLERFATLPEVR